MVHSIQGEIHDVRGELGGVRAFSMNVNPIRGSPTGSPPKPDLV